MNNKLKMPKLPKVNWKLFIIVILVIIIGALLLKHVQKFISGGEKEVSFVVLEKSQVPDKIQEILPRYKMLERALAAKADEQIYVIVTRGEKLTGGYSVEIEKMELVKEKEENRLVVYAVFKDPKPDELVTQVITHPYIVAKTDLKELPVKIDLKARFKE